jgi:hypothetical protein
MARDVTIGRDMAEKIVDALEEYADKHNDGSAYDYAAMIRREFGMVEQELKHDRS